MEAPAKSVECPQCHHSNPPEASRCVACATLFENADATLILDAAQATEWSRTVGPQKSFEGRETSLQEGSVLADRL